MKIVSLFPNNEETIFWLMMIKKEWEGIKYGTFRFFALHVGNRQRRGKVSKIEKVSVRYDCLEKQERSVKNTCLKENLVHMTVDKLKFVDLVIRI